MNGDLACRIAGHPMGLHSTVAAASRDEWYIRGLTRAAGDAPRTTLREAAPRRALSDSNAAYMSALSQQESARRSLDIVEGLLISVGQLAMLLGLSEQAIDGARVAGRIFGFETSEGRHEYPAFYADAGMPRQDLEDVTLALGEVPPSGKWQFFTTPKMSLDGRSPLQALVEGDLQAVMRSAAGFVER